MSYEVFLKEKVNQLKETKKILLIDGDDQRAIDAAKLLKKQKNIDTVILVEEDVNNEDGLEYINILKDKEKYDLFVNKYVERRKGKETIEQAQKVMKTRPFYAMMMLYLGEVDGVVGGLKFTTADILRAAFKVIGPKPGIKTISSIMIMHNEKQSVVFSDISVNVKPTSEQLAEIGLNAAEASSALGIEPKVAFLSFSTSGSAVTPESQLVKEATDLFNQRYEGTKAIGEVQLDAAIDLKVREAKYKRDFFKEPASVFVFPDLGAGNIGYKLVQRFGNYGAIGPIVVGSAKPVNDLSRGSSVDDVFNTVLITALQAQGGK